MIPPRLFPPGILKLVEMQEGKPFKVLAELPTTNRNRARLQQMRNDLLMTNPKLDLRLSENNAF